MAEQDDDRPRTHKWVRRPGEPRKAPATPLQLRVRVPEGDVPDADALAEGMREALRDWPVVILRVVGHADGPLKLGHHPGRWVRTRLGGVIDDVLDGGSSPRITNPNSPAHRLLGRHGRGNKPDGEAWAPFVVRADGMPSALGDNGGDVRFELMAPHPLNLVCFRHRGGREVSSALMESANQTGKLFLTHCELDGEFALRFCVGQAQTQRHHVEAAWSLISKLAPPVDKG